jgi:hypothetical protein
VSCLLFESGLWISLAVESTAAVSAAHQARSRRSGFLVKSLTDCGEQIQKTLIPPSVYLSMSQTFLSEISGGIRGLFDPVDNVGEFLQV